MDDTILSPDAMNSMVDPISVQPVADAVNAVPGQDPAVLAAELAEKASALSDQAVRLSEQLLNVTPVVSAPPVVSSDAAIAVVHGAVDPLVFGITIFILACFVGYYVVWKVTPALHTPLMAVTNAISGIIVVGAMLAMGAATYGTSSTVGLVAVVLASVNIFGGFIVTQRMLYMFRKKKK